MQNSSFRQDARRWLPGVLISAVALFVVFRLANWQDLGMAFRNLPLLNLVIAVGISVITLGTRSLAWRTLLEDRPDFWSSFFVINEGYLFNNLFPLRAGEIARAVLMGRITHLGPLHVLSTIVIERTFDLAMAAGLLLSTLPLALGMDWARPVAIVTLFLVVLGLTAMFYMARYSRQLQEWLERNAQRHAWINRWVIPRMGSLMDGLAVLTQPDRFLKALFWILISWAGWVVTHFYHAFRRHPWRKNSGGQLLQTASWHWELLSLQLLQQLVFLKVHLWEH